MSEIKTEIKSEAKSQNTEDSSLLEEVKADVIKSECPISVTNQDIKSDDIKTKTAINGVQVKSTKLKVDTSPEFEQVSPLSSPKASEFSISSIESFEDDVENIIICVGNEYAYHSYQDSKKDDLHKKDSYNAKESESYKESVRRQDDTKFDGGNSRSSRISDKSIKHGERSRSRDNNHSRYKYSSDKIRSSYSSSSYRYSRSWEKNRRRYTSNRYRRSGSWERNRRYRESRSPPYRAGRRRRQSRSRSRSRSISYNSAKLSLDKRGSLIKRRKLSSDSPARNAGKLLKFPDNWITNHQRKKSASPIPPPLPNSPPPPKPPPPVENNTVISQSPLTVNISNAGLSLYQWVSQGNQHLQNLYSFQNPAMPRISVNNLPLVPGLGNLPVHVTATGEQILHDMDGRPIPIGPNGRFLPVDMSGRLYPHIVFPYNNQAVPIYMTEDGVLRLPNGEPVPYGLPNQLPVNIDGSIIPIGPDSRPLYPCPNIPRQNPFISSQVENPAIPGIDSVECQRHVQRNPPLPAVTEVKTNIIMKKRFNQAKLPSAVIQIETVSDLEFKNRQTSPKVKEIENKSDSEKQLENKKSEASGATKTESTSEVQKASAETLPKFSAEISTVNSKVRKKKPYEDVDLPKLVEKFSERISKMKISAIYQKKIQRNLRAGMKLPETEENMAISKMDEKSGSGLRCDANPEKESLFTVHSEKFPGTSEKNSLDSKKDNELSAEEVLSEKKFTEAIHEAILLFGEIDFNPPVFGRFLFSKSSKNFINQSPPNESPLLKNTIQLPFLAPENTGSKSTKKKSSVNYRFLPKKGGKLPQKTTAPSVGLSFAVQCDFTSKRIQSLHAKIEKLRRELFQCKNENAELTDLYKSLRQENKKKTEELSKVLKKIEEKNKIIRDLSQPRK